MTAFRTADASARHGDAPVRRRLVALADDVERTMRALGAWSDPAPRLVPFRQPFAMDTMPFEHWLQLVLVPRMRALAGNDENLPANSNLAGHAVREFDGRDDMTPLVDVLRAIDDLSPAAPRTPGPPAVGLGRHPGLGTALIVLLTAWAFAAVWLAGRLAPALGIVSHPRVYQSFTGAIAPGDDFQPLRITVSAFDDGATIRSTDGNLVLVRSMRTMARGPTAPFDFPMSEPPTRAAVLDWLADFGVDEHADAAHAAAGEALAVVAAAARARTADALHAAAVTVDVRVHADELVRIAGRTPQWVELALTVACVSAGAVPIAAALVRMARRRRG